MLTRQVFYCVDYLLGVLIRRIWCLALEASFGQAAKPTL